MMFISTKIHSKDNKYLHYGTSKAYCSFSHLITGLSVCTTVKLWFDDDAAKVEFHREVCDSVRGDVFCAGVVSTLLVVKLVRQGVRGFPVASSPATGCSWISGRVVSCDRVRCGRWRCVLVQCRAYAAAVPWPWILCDSLRESEGWCSTILYVHACNWTSFSETREHFASYKCVVINVVDEHTNTWHTGRGKNISFLVKLCCR